MGAIWENGNTDEWTLPWKINTIHDMSALAKSDTSKENQVMMNSENLELGQVRDFVNLIESQIWFMELIENCCKKSNESPLSMNYSRDIQPHADNMHKSCDPALMKGTASALSGKCLCSQKFCNLFIFLLFSLHILLKKKQ